MSQNLKESTMEASVEALSLPDDSSTYRSRSALSREISISSDNTHPNQSLRAAAYAESMLFAETPYYTELAGLKFTSSKGSYRQIEKDEVLRLAESQLQKRRFYQPPQEPHGDYDQIEEEQQKPSQQKSVLFKTKTRFTDATHGLFSRDKTKGTEREVGLISHLLDMGYSPERIAALSDVLQQPIVMDSVEPSLITWLELQRSRGYWFDGISLILLALTTAVGRGHIESFWILMASWNGLVFSIPYLFAYLFICMPLLNFELVTGQITRSSPPNMMALLWTRARGLGMAMVVTTAATGCIVQCTKLINSSNKCNPCTDPNA